jgi:hypothetical protein
MPGITVIPLPEFCTGAWFLGFHFFEFHRKFPVHFFLGNTGQGGIGAMDRDIIQIIQI